MALQNLQYNAPRVSNWPLLFGSAVHFLWPVRNEGLFENVTPSGFEIFY